MLNKIYLYNRLNKKNAYLIVLIPRIYTDEIDIYLEREEKHIARLKEYFSPAITSGLVRFRQVEFDEVESNSLLREVSR